MITKIKKQGSQIYGCDFLHYSSKHLHDAPNYRLVNQETSEPRSFLFYLYNEDEYYSPSNQSD